MAQEEGIAMSPQQFLNTDRERETSVKESYTDVSDVPIADVVDHAVYGSCSWLSMERAEPHSSCGGLMRTEVRADQNAHANTISSGASPSLLVAAPPHPTQSNNQCYTYGVYTFFFLLTYPRTRWCYVHSVTFRADTRARQNNAGRTSSFAV
jgi:hypothetical protein